MASEDKKYKIVYLTPSLYVSGGLERVLTLKANYFADHFGYDVTIILTDGKDKPFFYPLSDKIKIINLDINFEELWFCPMLKKTWLYLKKQRVFRRRLTEELMRLRPDITISLLRREVNFLNDIQDGSRKIGELHVNRQNYRDLDHSRNPLKRLFAWWWMRSLTGHLRQLDRFVVLTCEDRKQWVGLHNVEVIPDPLSFTPPAVSTLTEKRVIAVGRYTYQKGFDILLRSWASVEKQFPEWHLAIFGAGNNEPYKQQARELGLDPARCHIMNNTPDIQSEYLKSSLFVFSSRFEGFGMVLVEAMACGLPVVSFDCPCGPLDIVTDDVDGYLVSTGDADQLAARMAYLMGHHDELQRMSQHARDKASYYAMDRLALRWKRLFDEVMSNR